MLYRKFSARSDVCPYCFAGGVLTVLTTPNRKRHINVLAP